MEEELYKEIDLIISNLIENNFIIADQKSASNLYDKGIAFLKTNNLIKNERHKNRYVANSNDIFDIQKIGIKKYLEDKNNIVYLETQIKKLTRDNLRLNNWDIRFRWVIAACSFVIGFITKYFISN